MQFELTEDNFIMFAVKNYDNPSCHGMDEFYDDLKRFKYIKRLLHKHNVGKDLKERLILNHIIILGNLFGIEATTKMFEASKPVFEAKQKATSAESKDDTIVDAEVK